MSDICEVCGKKRAVHTHHRKLRRHNDERAGNLMRVDLECHDWIHSHVSESYARGLLVHSWADPYDVEVYADTPETDYTAGGHEKFENSVTVIGMPIEEGAICPMCERRKPHKKKASSPKTKVWSTRIPVGDSDSFSELVDAAAAHHGLIGKPNHRFWALNYALVLLLQGEPGDLPVG